MIAFQVVTLQFWLTISAHSGQVAIPWMMNEGRVLFDTILEQHAPGTSLVAAAAQWLLPLDVATVARLLNTLLMALITLGVYWLGVQYGESPIVGLLAAALWALLSPVYGNVLFYFNTLLVGFTVWGLLAWLRYEDSGRVGWLIVTGLLLGCTALAKQQGWAVIGLFGLWLLFTRRSLREAFIYGMAAALLPLLVIVVIAAQGNFDAYLFWNWTFNFSGYMDGVPLNSNFFRKLLFTNALVPAFALLWWRQAKPHLWLIGLLYLALLLPLYPRFGESAAVTHIPFVALMSGIVLHHLWRSTRRDSAPPRDSDWIAWGMVSAIALSWLWMGAVMYVPGVVRTPGYDEYAPIVAALEQAAAPGNTLFVLPETDSTPQLHPLTGMLPPQTWIKGWRWYLEPPGVRDALLAEWEQSPPDFVVLFPDLMPASQPAINPLLAFVEAEYQERERFPAIPFHGEAVIYQRRGTQP